MEVMEVRGEGIAAGLAVHHFITHITFITSSISDCAFEVGCTALRGLCRNLLPYATEV